MLPAVAVTGLAAYRIARVIAHDKIGEPIRHRAYESIARWPKFGVWLNSLVTCPFCLTVYASAGGVLWYAAVIGPWPGAGAVLLMIPAAAGVAAFLSAADLAMTMYVDKHPL